MTKKQKDFYEYLQKLKSYDNLKFVETALKAFSKYWEIYEKTRNKRQYDGCYGINGSICWISCYGTS